MPKAHVASSAPVTKRDETRREYESRSRIIADGQRVTTRVAQLTVVVWFRIYYGLYEYNTMMGSHTHSTGTPTQPERRAGPSV